MREIREYTVTAEHAHGTKKSDHYTYIDARVIASNWSNAFGNSTIWHKGERIEIVGKFPKGAARNTDGAACGWAT